MQKKVLIGAMFFALLIALLGQNAPQKFNWETKLDPNEKNPFGLYVLNQQIDSLFPAGVERLSFSPFERLSATDSSKTNILSLGEMPETASLKTLRQHADKGNTVFIAPPQMRSSPWGKTESVYAEYAAVTLSGFDEPYSLKDQMVTYFTDVPPKTEVLGHIAINNAIYPNFVRVPQGRGWVYLHADALIFPNYGLLLQNPEYATSALSDSSEGEPPAWHNPRHRKVSDSGVRDGSSRP